MTLPDLVDTSEGPYDGPWRFDTGTDRGSFAREFRQEAVRLTESGDRRWIKQDRRGREQAFPAKVPLKIRDE